MFGRIKGMTKVSWQDGRGQGVVYIGYLWNDSSTGNERIPGYICNIVKVVETILVTFLSQNITNDIDVQGDPK